MENQNTRNTMTIGQYIRTPGTNGTGAVTQTGMSPGMGVGMGAGMSPGMGATMGSGMGVTMGPGMGATMAPGMGITMAPGMGATMAPGMGATMAPGMGATMSPGMGTATGPAAGAGAQTNTQMSGNMATTTMPSHTDAAAGSGHMAEATPQAGAAMPSAVTNGCTGDAYDGFGLLPACAPLANPYVPFQMTNSKQYLPSKGVMRGTLFPGLDLPFHAMVNEGELWGTPLAELMALDFAIKELQLYLDTHPNDSEVLSLLVSYIAMQNEGTQKYVSLYGPVSIRDVQAAQGYTWIKDPWPWEYVKES